MGKTTVRNKFLDNLALLFWIVPPYLGLLSAYLTKTRYDAAIILTDYGLYAIATTVLAIGYWMLCRRARGRVAVWLVSVAYAESFFAVTLWGIVLLFLARMMFPGLMDESEAPLVAHMLERIARGLIGLAMGGTLLAAAVLVYGFRRGQLDRPVWPLPFEIGMPPEVKLDNPEHLGVFARYDGWDELPETFRDDYRLSEGPDGYLRVEQEDGLYTKVPPEGNWYVVKNSDDEITIWKAPDGGVEGVK